MQQYQQLIKAKKKKKKKKNKELEKNGEKISLIE